MKTKLFLLVLTLLMISLSFAAEKLIDWKPNAIQLDKDGHYRGPHIKPYRGEPVKSTVDHRAFGEAKPECQSCHNDPEMGYGYVSSELFVKTKHYDLMLKKGQIGNIQNACLVCHVNTNNQFISYPGDNLSLTEPFSVYKIENDNVSTCGKCHQSITEKNKTHIMATAKGHYYRSELFPYMEALSVSAKQVYQLCNSCHTSCASSCHMVSHDKKAIDWTFIQPYLDHKVGPPKEAVNVEIAKGVEFKASPIQELLIGHYIKGGGPGYRMLAKMGKAPLETIMLDIASHELVVPNDLPKETADDICLRCHTCMVNPQDRLNKTLAHQSVKCVDCHKEGDVHGHEPNYARFAYEAVDPSCTTCHLKEDINKGRAETKTATRQNPIVSKTVYDMSPTIPPVTGAHQNVSCEICHSSGIKQCTECHVGDLVDTVGYINELDPQAVFYGKDVNHIVRPLLLHEIYGADKKTKYGGWIMKKTVHNIKKDVHKDCETCHTDPTRMGVSILQKRLINTYLLKQAGVKEAYINKNEHYQKVGAQQGATCMDCHVHKDASTVEKFHQTIGINRP
jgi:hypothetical protein